MIGKGANSGVALSSVKLAMTASFFRDRLGFSYGFELWLSHDIRGSGAWGLGLHW